MLVPLWKRPEIVKLFIERMRLTMPDNFELIPYFVISEEDPFYKVLIKLTRGYKIFLYKNDPLGEKKNAALLHAMQWDWDYIMDMGSDNLWISYLWYLYDEYLDVYEYFGIKNLHFIDIIQNRACYLEGYHLDVNDNITALGVGRCVHRDIINDIKEPWRNNWNHGMDGCSHHKITQAGYNCTVIDNGEVPTILDVKTATNLNLYIDIVNGAIEIKPRLIYEWFGLNQFNIYNSDFTELTTFNGFRDEVVKARNYFENQEKAFNAINTTYEIGFGEKRYKNYRVYLTQQTKQAKK